jgi:copper resistance protein C
MSFLQAKHACRQAGRGYNPPIPSQERTLFQYLPRSGEGVGNSGQAGMTNRAGLMPLCINSSAVITGVLLTLLFALPAASWAHAFPDHSDPKVGSTVNSSPSMVRIWFDGDIEPVFSTLMVHTMDGRMVSKGNGQVDSKDSTLLEVGVPPLPPGQYLVIWSVIARDGHHTMGQYTFTIK